MSVSAIVPASPYKGLTPFGDTDLDALLFFGRERDAEIVVANLIASRLTVLYGSSGVGKSSMLRAGVARTLRGLPERPLVVVFSSWGEDPLGALVAAIAAEAGVEPAANLLETVERAQEARGDVYLILDQAEEYFLYHAGEGRFEPEFARLVTEPLRVNVLLSLREDALAQLDRFKARIPNILGNYLRLDRLGRAAGRDAILNPVERYRALGGAAVAVEAELVDAVLDQVTVGRIGYALGGLGGVEGNGKPAGIEAPFLQLVMQRVWEVERTEGSDELRAETLGALGGAQTVVADHLERAMAALEPRQQEIAAQLFNHLVTPSGTKIAHGVADLAEYAGVPEAEVRPVVASLAEHRILRPDESGRFEIFHDVLAGAVLGWRTRYEADRAVARARAGARRRNRRLGFLALGALVALAAMAALTAYAFDQRNEAQAQQEEAAAQSQLALANEQKALEEGKKALVERRKRLDQEERALDERRRILALNAEVIALRRARAKERKQLQALTAATAAQEASLAQLEDETAQQQQQVDDLERESADLDDQIAAADKELATQTQQAQAQQLVAASAEQLPVDPELGLLLATEAAKLAPTSPVVENGLRTAVQFSDVRASWDLGGEASSMAADGGTLVAGTDDGRILITAATPGATPQRERQASRVSAAAVSRDGAHVATGGRNGAVRLWTAQGRAGAALEHNGPVVAIAFSPDAKRVATASEDRTVKLWDRSSGKLLHALRHGDPLVGVGFSRDGTRLVTWGGKEARLYAVDGGGLVRRFEHPTKVLDAELSPDGSLLATGGEDRAARLWSTVSGELAKAPLTAHRGQVRAVAFSPDGKLLATASTDNAGRVWDVASGAQEGQLSHSNYVTDIRFSPNGRWLLTTGRDSVARVWDTEGTAKSLLAGHGRAVVGASFTADGTRVVTAGEDGTARLWDPGTQAQLTVTGRDADAALVKEPATSATSPDGRMVATVDGKTVVLRPAAGGGPVRRLLGHGNVVNSVAFSPDSRLLVTASRDHDARVWDVATGALEQVLARHSGSVADARFSPDGKWLLTAGPITAGLWRVDGWSFVDYLRGPESPPVTGVAFGPDSRTVVTRERDGTVRRGNCTLCGGVSELLRVARKQLDGTGRRLTPAERRQFVR